MKNKFYGFLRSIWGMLSHNFGLKILSLVLAILLWSSVVSSNTSITRNRVISGLSAYITNQSVLNNTYGLAMMTDPEELLENISVQIQVPLSYYGLLSEENVQVTLDLSSVRSAGTQEVPLKATTTYGKVLKIMPETVSITFESIDSRSVPVNAFISGEEQETLWYSITRKNPEELVISGASSLVQSIVSADVYVDVTDRTDPFVTAARYVLRDAEGNEVSQDMLNRSATSVTVSADVYPTKELPISNEISDVIQGQVAEGYQITEISIQPESVTVAAEEELLEGLTELLVQPILIDSPNQSFSQRVRISSLTDFKYISTEQVYVNVTIEEMETSSVITDVRVAFPGLEEDLNLTWTREEISVKVTGPISKVKELEASGLDAMIDLNGLTAGEYRLALEVDEELYPGLTFEFTPATLSLRLEEKPEE
ncbi:MAG TPA: hypothetical protein IAB02_01480 [Candidatus Pullichristensenella excrementigallinarum]|uniref:YbbR-like protein n=1 Tax=Candidatus Pullichristensenella excrementigallinarum TaxID=2840907 RepID=A0A9D1I9X6_9FIRM|nr:hypothetical protein [Candidatus Pullichristensenella excrementigallinarum]